MAAPIGYAQTNTNGVNFVVNNLQAQEISNNAGNTNSVPLLPSLIGLEPQAALSMSARNPGGVCYRGGINSVFLNNNAGAILVDAFESSVARLGYQKSGAFMVVCSGTNAVSVPLTNTQTNTNGYFGDTTFATANVLLWKNCSGQGDNNNGVSASMSINGSGTNGNKMGLTTNSQITLDGGGSIWWSQSNNGFTVNAANAQVTITPTNGGVFVGVIAGS